MTILFFIWWIISKDREITDLVIWLLMFYLLDIISIMWFLSLFELITHGVN